MIRSGVRWLVAVPTPDGNLEPFRLSPLGAALEFTAPVRSAAEQALLTSGITLPAEALLISRVEFDEIKRSSIRRPIEVLSPRARMRVAGPKAPTLDDAGTAA